MRVAFFTSFSFSYLNRARVLAKSLKRFHPDWEFIALMTDEPPAQLPFSVEKEPFDRVVWSKDLDIPEFNKWAFRHNIVEICTAVKGPLMRQLSREGYDRIFYFDPDTVVFSSLQPLIDRLDEKDILLTPHQLGPETDDIAIRDNEIGSLKWGVYNLGFAGVACRGDGLRFADWWGERMLSYCFDDIPSGLFVDQRWCDLAPAFFPALEVVRDPGCNVASWNLSQRTIRIERDGSITVNGEPLKFFHFTKLGALGDTMTERYARDNAEVYELWSWYKREIDANTDDRIPDRYWHYGVFENGDKVTDDVRRLYRDRLDLQAAFPEPFSTGAGTFHEWLQHHYDRDAA